MGMRSASSDGATSFFEASGTESGRGIVSSLGSKVMSSLFLGFFFCFLLVPSDDSESWLAGCGLDGGRGLSNVSLGFQLEIEAISALVILPMGLDGVEAVCSADSVEDGMGGSGGRSDPPSQVLT